MISAMYEHNEEMFDEFSRRQSDNLKNLLSLESGLVYYGHFTRADIATMKPIEYRFHIAEIQKRFEASKSS